MIRLGLALLVVSLPSFAQDSAGDSAATQRDPAAASAPSATGSEARLVDTESPPSRSNYLAPILGSTVGALVGAAIGVGAFFISPLLGFVVPFALPPLGALLGTSLGGTLGDQPGSRLAATIGSLALTALMLFVVAPASFGAVYALGLGALYGLIGGAVVVSAATSAALYLVFAPRPEPVVLREPTASVVAFAPVLFRF